MAIELDRVRPVPGLPTRGPQTDQQPVYTTNGIESLNARFRAAMRRRGHFPDQQSALKVLYLAQPAMPNTKNQTGVRPDFG
jgi:transposase-like protein